VEYIVNKVSICRGAGMPLYEYVCNECGQPFEKMMRFSELNQSPNCPTCAGTNTRKQISLFASSSSSSPSTSSGCGNSPTNRFH
jgi:putative FmdB family regulatory protein